MQKIKFHSFSYLVFLICVFHFFLFPFNFPPSAYALSTLKTLPEFLPVKDTEGNFFSSDFFQGKYTALFFFSIYSSDSRELIDFMEELYQEYSAAGVPLTIVGIDIDPSADEILDFLHNVRVSYPILFDTSLQMTGSFSVRKVPALFLIQPDMKIKYSMSGFHTGDKKTISLQLEELLKTAEKSQPQAAQKKVNTYTEKTLVTSDFTDIKFSPGNPSLLLYISSENDLWVYNINSRQRNKIASGVATADWAPTGDTLVFSLSDKPGLWMTKLTETKTARITNFGYDPVWSPSGNYIAFRQHDSEIWIYDTMEKKRWRAPVDGIGISWSADGKLLIVKDKKGRAWLISPLTKMSVLKALQH